MLGLRRPDQGCPKRLGDGKPRGAEAMPGHPGTNGEWPSRDPAGKPGESNSMTVGVIKDNASFYALRSEWDALLSENLVNTIFLTWEWLYEWWNSFGQSEQLL